MVHNKTLEFYNASADEYRLKIGASHTPYLNEFIGLLEQGSRVLDLGCGPGHCAAFFANAGFDVDAIDASDEMIKLAAANAGVRAWTASFDDIPLTTKYDAIWANFSLLHADRTDFARHLRTLRQISTPNAVLHLGLKIGDGHRIDHLGRYYAYYQPVDLVGLLHDAGFTEFEIYLGSGKGMAGLDEPWVVVWSRAT